MKNTTYKLPTLKALTQEVKRAKAQIEADDLDLTIGWDGENWDAQTGDNTFFGPAYHYPFWAVATVGRRDNSKEVARDLLSQLAEYDLDDPDLNYIPPPERDC